MPKTRSTNIVTMDGNEDTIFNTVGLTDTYFEGKIMAKELASGDTLRIRVYNRNDGASYYPFDSDVNDYCGSNNGTITYNSNLKALYKFDGTINDSTSGAHNLTLSAGTTTYTTGKEGQAIVLDGSTYYTANSAIAVTGTGDRSFSFWFYLTAYNAQSGIFSYGVASKNSGLGIEFLNATDGRAIFFGYANDITINTNFQLNTWYHVVVTVGSTGTVRTVYVNGVQDIQLTTTAVNTTSSTFYIGQNIFSGINLKGYIDEFRSYGITLTQAQVSALYMVGKYGQSHTFDGGEYISNSTPTSIPIGNNAFSCAFWINPTSEAATSTIVSWGTNSAGEAVIINLTTSGAILVSKQGTTIVTSSGTLSTGSYQHVVVTSDGTTTKVYINGTIDANSGTSSFNTVIGSLYIGDLFGGSQPLIGQLDDLRIYNRALSASDVTDLYNNPAPMKSVLYDKTYGGPLSPTTCIYVPYITSNQYTLTAQQTTSTYYKSINGELYSVT